MEEIFLQGRRINYKDWSIRIGDHDEFVLTVEYPSGKSYMRPLDEWTIEPTVVKGEGLLFHKDRKRYQEIQESIHLGNKYIIVTYPGNKKPILMRNDHVEIIHSTNLKKEKIFEYFKETAAERLNNANTEKDKIIAENIVSQFDKIIPFEGTVLNSYISKKSELREEKHNLIYPFGINETQLQAVKRAFLSQVSIIEGPPGTGKTQTILNIIANIIVSGKTCAIVSNNNAAVENVYEKMEEVNLDFLVAKLGKGKYRKKFLNDIVYTRPDKTDSLESLEEIKSLQDKLEKNLEAKNDLAKLISEIEEIEIEKRYLDEWMGEHPELKAEYIEKYKLNTIKAVDLMAYLKCLSDQFLKFKDKIQLLLHYRIFNSKYLNDMQQRENFILSLQLTYYENLLKEKYNEKSRIEELLEKADFDRDLKAMEECSMRFLKGYITENMPNDTPQFSDKDYRKKFHDFIRYFPIIGSGTHSLMNSIGEGCLLDYVIIDEASLQDLVPGILCFGCAKNAVVVGDKKQLSHIPSPTQLVCPDKVYDCTKYSLLDSVREVFGEDIPVTLLKEHYRCHPKIIQFCNKQFYDNELIPMKQDHGEEALSLIKTALGNHMRNYKNQREIESVMKAQESCGFVDNIEHPEGYRIGFIAPYNNQVSLAKEMMPQEIVKDTIHKFQGRGCDEIIFSTVLDKKAVSQRQLNFVDESAMINVAVSRAKSKFTLVTGNDVFINNNKHIAALIRYIEYYAAEEEIHDSPVISAFDLLYKEYDKSLEKLAERLNPADSRYPSEQIAAVVLRDIFAKEQFKMIVFHSQVYLKQLVSIEHNNFTEEEIRFINNRASCDFVIYYRIGKKPLAVIEIDGGCHDKPEQIERDKKKDSILMKSGICLLRIRTTDSKVEEKMEKFLRESMEN